jgi:hypothetical protein
MTHHPAIPEVLKHLDYGHRPKRVDGVDLLDRDEDSLKSPKDELIGQQEQAGPTRTVHRSGDLHERPHTGSALSGTRR